MKLHPKARAVLDAARLWVVGDNDLDTDEGMALIEAIAEWGRAQPVRYPVWLADDLSVPRAERFDPELVEALAALAHDEHWSGWMRYMLPKLGIEDRGEEGIAMPSQMTHEAARHIQRWIRQMNTPYAELSEKERESDRVEARRILELLREYGIPHRAARTPPADHQTVTLSLRTDKGFLASVRSELNGLFIAKGNAERYRRDLEVIDRVLGLDEGRYFPDNDDRLKAIAALKGG